MEDTTGEAQQSFCLQDYRQLSEIHFQIRKLIQPGERAARLHEIEPQQLHLLLTIKGLPRDLPPTIGNVAARLCIKQHTVVSLANRLERRGTVIRQKGIDDRREVRLKITEAGEAILTAFSAYYALELSQIADKFIPALQQTLAILA